VEIADNSTGTLLFSLYSRRASAMPSARATGVQSAYRSHRQSHRRWHPRVSCLVDGDKTLSSDGPCRVPLIFCTEPVVQIGFAACGIKQPGRFQHESPGKSTCRLPIGLAVQFSLSSALNANRCPFAVWLRPCVSRRAWYRRPRRNRSTPVQQAYLALSCMECWRNSMANINRRPTTRVASGYFEVG